MGYSFYLFSTYYFILLYITKKTIGRKKFGAILTLLLGGSAVRRFYPSDHLLYDLRRPTPGLTRLPQRRPTRALPLATAPLLSPWPLVPSPPSPRDAAAAQPTSRSAPPPSRRPAIPTPSRHPPPRAATAVPSRHPLPAIPPNLRGAKFWRHERTASGSRRPTGSAAAVGGQGPRGSWCPALPEPWPQPPVPVRACREGLQVNATGHVDLPQWTTSKQRRSATAAPGG